MRRGGGLLMVFAVGACGGGAADKPSPEARSGSIPTADASQSTRSATADAREGVPVVSSLPRKDWPCAVVFEQGERGPIGAAWWDGGGPNIEYGGPEHCQFPPDRWEPGCPTEIGERQFRYDASGRLSEYSEAGFITAGDLVYAETGIVSIENCLFYRSEGQRAEVRAKGDCGVGFDTRQVELGSHGLPTTVLSFDAAGEPSVRQVSTFEQSRLTSRTMEFYVAGAWKLMATERFAYKCG